MSSFTDSLLGNLDGSDLSDLGSLLDSLLGNAATQNTSGTTDSASTAESEIESDATKVTEVLGSLLEAIASSEVSSQNTNATSDSTATTSGSIVDSTSTDAEKATSGTQTSQLEVDKVGIDKLVQDILGGTSGLAEIFSQEGAAGLYKSTVAAQASGDLLGNVAGEIAKLTGKQVVTTAGAESTTGASVSNKIQDIINTQNSQTASTTSGTKDATSTTDKTYSETTDATENQTKTQSQSEIGQVKAKQNAETEEDGVLQTVGNILGL